MPSGVEILRVHKLERFWGWGSLGGRTLGTGNLGEGFEKKPHLQHRQCWVGTWVRCSAGLAQVAGEGPPRASWTGVEKLWPGRPTAHAPAEQAASNTQNTQPTGQPFSINGDRVELTVGGTGEWWGFCMVRLGAKKTSAPAHTVKYLQEKKGPKNGHVMAKWVRFFWGG